MITVTVSENDATDRVGSQLSDYRNGLFSCLFDPLGVDDQDFFFTYKKAGLSIHSLYYLGPSKY